MQAQATQQQHPMQCILHSLGLAEDALERRDEAEGFRIEFERNFAIEIEPIDSVCRLSARISSLGKSLQAQETQIIKGLQMTDSLHEEMPTGVSLAVSDYDACLRLCIELVEHADAAQTMASFHQFVNFAFAFKQTYLQM